MIAFVLMIIIGLFISVSYYYNSKHYFSKYNKKIQRGNMLTFCISLACIVSGSLLLGSINWSYNLDNNVEIISDSILINTAKKEVAFEDSVYNYILFLNIKHPEVVFKQAKIESGNFKSKVFKENNNMFGMKIPLKRANIVGGENLGYAVYNTWQESIIDYALYQTYSAKGMNKEQYIQHLGASYAEDPNYKNKIK